MPKKTSKQLDAEIEAVVGAPIGKRPRRAKKPLPAHEVELARLKALRGVMRDALGDAAWDDVDLGQLEGWIAVDPNLTDRAWLAAAKDQLVAQSVLPEHAGAPPTAVYRWNDVFIATYRMNIDDGMSPEDAIDSARQNANDTVRLKTGEHELTKTDPKLY